jgi:hypothetical protein
MTSQKPREPISQATEVATGGAFQPPPAGSIEEYAETALIVGFPGAFGVTCNTVERLVRSRLLWEC